MRALVTGAAGFIGSHLVDRLVSEGAHVIGIDAFTDYYPRSEKEKNLAAVSDQDAFTLVEGSLDALDLKPLLNGVTHVFHLAAQPGVRKSWGKAFHEYTVNNIDATQQLLDACTSRPLERFVYASSSSIYGDAAQLPMLESAVPEPVSPYGVTKLAAEHLCNLYHTTQGVPATIVRYFTVYGPRQRPDMAFRRFLEAADAGREISIYGDGRQTRDFTYVDDAVRATVAAARDGSPGSVYNIGGGSRIAIMEVLEIIERLVGHPLLLDRQESQSGDMRDTLADTTRAQHELGFAPAVSLDEGLRAEYKWLLTTASPSSA
jgi:nucleoside-diphosphate-sugar epimerase